MWLSPSPTDNSFACKKYVATVVRYSRVPHAGRDIGEYAKPHTHNVQRVYEWHWGNPPQFIYTVHLVVVLFYSTLVYARGAMILENMGFVSNNLLPFPHIFAVFECLWCFPRIKLRFLFSKLARMSMLPRHVTSSTAIRRYPNSSHKTKWFIVLLDYLIVTRMKVNTTRVVHDEVHQYSRRPWCPIVGPSLKLSRCVSEQKGSLSFNPTISFPDTNLPALSLYSFKLRWHHSPPA